MRAPMLFTIVGLFNALIGPAYSADTKQEIIDRCRRQMSQYGSVMMKACVDQDVEAAGALAKYPNGAKEIIS